MSVVKVPISGGKFMLVNVADLPFLGSQAWCFDRRHGYAGRHRSVDGVRFHEKAHRLIARAKPGDIVDHINRDKLDNRRENLRIVSHSANLANGTKHANNMSGYRGVFWVKAAGKWMAQASLSKKLTYLGLYINKEDAARAYDAALLAHYGAHTGTNFTEQHNGV